MRLYLTATWRYVGTQDEAKKDGKGWRLEEVPTDKQGLIDYLNAMSGDPAEPSVPDDEPVVETTTPPPTITQPTLDAIAVKVTQFKTDEIVDFILDHASIDQVATIHSCIGTRFAEHIKETRK